MKVVLFNWFTFQFLYLISTTLCAQINIDQLAKDFDTEIPKIMKANHVPGAFVALIESDQVIYQAYFGYSDLKYKLPITNQTGFNIGSISKVFAAWGIMRLVEKGKIGLDSAANKYLNQWQFPESDYDSNLITIRSLLSHTAGLSVHGYYGWKKVKNKPTLLESLSGTPKKYTKVALIAEPQTKYQYSGGGYSVLQQIIEEVTGDKFEHYMDTAVLSPMGMYNSSFTIDDRILAQSSKEYNKRGREIQFEHFTETAAAGLHTTPDDLIKFIKLTFSKLNSGKSDSTVISASTLNEMLKVVPASEKTIPYGLGYRRQHSSNSWWHGGANSGWWAIIGINPQHNFGLIVLTNSFSGNKVERFAFEAWNKRLIEITNSQGN
ncbi:MAG: serine hydrolase domain-containing protein [Cytophagales bacterium]|nr:serine hydrolase domain-containing protein [Cytophagales bacterium]